MKSLILIFVILIISSCSFDNKTGLWKDASDIPVDNQIGKSIDSNEVQSQYEDILAQDQIFNEEINTKSSFFFELEAPVGSSKWLEQFGSKTNNTSNFNYSGNKILHSKSSKLNKLTINKNIVFYNNNLINFDHKGKIFIYSLDSKKKTFEYNFYKKKFKNFIKEIFFIVDRNILYVADNLGYLYAINLSSNSLIWAKNYGIPFRSNIKIVDEQIFLANQDNVIYSIDIKTGVKNWEYATTLTFLKSDFKNNFVIDETSNALFFLNTSGELYAIDYVSEKINWLLNFKNISLSGDTDLFLSQPIVFKNNILIISTEKSVLSLNSFNGSRNWILKSRPILKPILTNNYTYILSKNDLIICIENKTGNVLWSKNVFSSIGNRTMNKIGKFNDIKIVNNEINLFTKNGYLLSFDYKNGNLNYIKKISKNGISSEIVFLKDNMLLIDNNNKLLKFN
jgi:outer membrane protein assembly factor BamB